MRTAVQRWVSGMAVAVVSCVCSARTLYWYGGVTDVPDGTPLPTALSALTGTWNTSTKNWATDDLGTTYTNWSNAGTENQAYLGRRMNTWVRYVVATNTLAGDITLNRLTGDFSAIGNYDATFLFTSAVPVTVTLNGFRPTVLVDNQDGFENITLTPSVRLAGAAGFNKFGRGDLRIQSDSSGVAGTVAVGDVMVNSILNNANSGILEVQSSGNLRGVSRFSIAGNAPVFRVYPAAGAQNQLADSAEINFQAGVFLYRGVRGGTPSQETIGRLRLDTSGFLDLANSLNSSGTLGQLILGDATSGIDRGQDGKGCLRIGVTSTDTVVTDTIVQNGLATGVVLPWILTSRGQPVQLSGTKVITPVATTVAPLNLSSWTTGNKYRIEAGAYTGTIPNVTIDSLGILWAPATHTNLTIGAGNTLTLSQGLLGRGSAGGVNRVTFTGGKITSGTSELYVLLSDWSGSAISIDSEITGDLSLIQGGLAVMGMGGTNSNTYTGTTYVLGGQLNLTKNRTVAIPGNLVVGRAEVNSFSNQIASAANVTVRDGGILSTAHQPQTFSGTVTLEKTGRLVLANASGGPILNKAGTGLVMDGGLLLHSSSSSGLLRLFTDVSYPTDAISQAVMRWDYSNVVDNQTITLCDAAGTYTRTFDIGKSVNVTDGKAEMEVSMPLREVTGTAGITKTGAGTLALRRVTHELSGNVAVNGGRLVSAGAWRQISRQGTLWSPAYGLCFPHYTVADLSRTDDLVVGQPVSGIGITVNSVIAAIDSPSQIRLSIVTTNHGPVALTFAGGRSAMGRHLVLTGTRTSGSPIITGLSSTAGLIYRQPVVGSGVAGYVLSVDSATQVTLSANAASSGTATITFNGGSAVGRGPVAVNSTGTLAGEGVAGAVTVNNGGTLDAGVLTNAVGTLQLGNGLTFLSGSTLQVDIAGDASNDQLQVFGDLALDGAVSVSLLGAYAPSSAEWTIATYTGTASGSMAAPGGYKVSIDSANKRVLLKKSLGGFMILVR